MRKISVWSRQQENEDKELKDRLGRRILGLVQITEEQSGGDKEMERARRRRGGGKEEKKKKKEGKKREKFGEVQFPEGQ